MGGGWGEQRPRGEMSSSCQTAKLGFQRRIILLSFELQDLYGFLSLESLFSLLLLSLYLSLYLSIYQISIYLHLALRSLILSWEIIWPDATSSVAIASRSSCQVPDIWHQRRFTVLATLSRR